MRTAGAGDADRAVYGLRPGDRVVGFIGQLIDRKNPLPPCVPSPG